jgi:hypothetical protein
MFDFGGILKSLPGERAHEIDQLDKALTGADEKSRNVLAALATPIPISTLADIRDRAQHHARAGTPKGYGWAIAALKAERRSA